MYLIQYNCQTSSLKKVFGNKVLNFGTKKVLWNKKPLEIKSYHFETLCSGTFFLALLCPQKSPIIVENAWKQLGCLQPWKKGLDIKNAPGYIKYADA